MTNSMKVHYMSMSVDWATPKGVYDELNAEFHFNDDPCPLFGGELIDSVPPLNGLTREWGVSTFVNPPYGRGIGAWTAKALAESKRGKTVVMLIPSRTDTIWWHRDIMQADEIRFVKGRLKFGSAKQGAPFPSAVVVFQGNRCLHFGAGIVHRDSRGTPLGITYTASTCPDCSAPLDSLADGDQK